MATVIVGADFEPTRINYDPQQDDGPHVHWGE